MVSFSCSLHSTYPPSPFSISFLEQRTSPVSVIAPTARWRCRQLETEESKKAVQELEAILEGAKLYEDAFSMDSDSDTFSLSGTSEASSLLSEEEEGVFTALTRCCCSKTTHIMSEMIRSLRIFPIVKLFKWWIDEAIWLPRGVVQGESVIESDDVLQIRISICSTIHLQGKVASQVRLRTAPSCWSKFVEICK